MKELDDKKNQRSKECLFVYEQFMNLFVRAQILGQIRQNPSSQTWLATEDQVKYCGNPGIQTRL